MSNEKDEKLVRNLEILGSIFVLFFVAALLYSNLKEISLAQYEFIQEHYDKDCLNKALDGSKTKKIRVHQYTAYQSCLAKKESANNGKSYKEQREDIKKEIFKE